MFDFVPIYNYTHYFDLSILILVLIAVWQCSKGSILRKDVVELNATWGVVFTLILILYMGLRPVNGVFGDMVTYARGFESERFQSTPITWRFESEWLFYNMLKWFAHNSEPSIFFLVCSALYIIPLWIAMHRIFKSYYYIPLIVIFGMFTFWNYGVNGIRNGIGVSFIILAMTYVDNLPIAGLLCFIAFGFHKSVLMLVGALILAWFYKKSYTYLAIWVACIPISLIFGNTIQNFFTNLSLFMEDARYADYISGDNLGIVELTLGFRWDFLIYSAMGTIVGYYFIFVRNFKDEYYHWIYNVFLITNAFWILIIRASYTNRIAQISWFIMPIVLIYPFMKKRFWINHEKMLGYGILIFYSFAFYYNILR